MDQDSLDPVFAGLEPSAVWRHFSTLCRMPRQSKAEAALRDHLRAWADGRGLATTIDAAGNLLVRKPASAGCGSAAGVVLQAHLDMVCQKNSDSSHDFARDPNMDIVSFGPTIRGAHAPGERVDIASVGRVWHLLTAILAAAAGPAER
jgi:di/tripeptidase